MSTATLLAYEYSEFPKDKLPELINLIETGGQVQRVHIDENLPIAEWIVMLIDGGKIVSTATIKNPKSSYRKRIFKEAGVETLRANYPIELGYISTASTYTGKGYGKKVMLEAMRHIGGRSTFATTRNPKMIGMLEKNGFKQAGQQYKEDLFLFVYN